MVIILENMFIRLSVETVGAEIISLYSKEHNTEYICPKEKPVWHEQAPILFPVVGNLKDGYYIYHDAKYNCTTHGFARFHEFEVNQISAYKAEFVLTDSPETYQNYPFRFTLKITYELVDRSVIVSSEVINNSTETLICALGFHPGFNCPLEDGLSAEDYSLVFPEDMYAHKIIMENGCVKKIETDTYKALPLIKIKQQFFENGVVGLTEITGNHSVTLFAGESHRYIRINYPDFPVLAIWAPQNEPVKYVCIEPRYGLQDFTDSDHSFENKPGMMHISSKESITNRFTIDIG